MSDSLHNCMRPFGRVAALEDPRSYKYSITSHLHHEGGISRSRHTAGGEVHNRKTAQVPGLADQLKRCADLLGKHINLVFIHGLQLPNTPLHCPDMAHSLHHIASSCLTLGADHGRALCNPSKGLTQVSATAQHGHVKVVLVDVMNLVCRGQDLALINVVNTNRLQNLGFYKVTNAGLGHDWNGDSCFDGLNHFRVRHTSYTSIFANVSGDPLQGHHCDSACFFSNTRLFNIDDIHDASALEHLCKAYLHGKCSFLRISHYFLMCTLFVKM
mmetsp:Transcript_27271/g.37610  ORF Transcript_27271/g.37610 Transcript_27271/m.37610 type:complete len:271 (+) Transcript_27271:255-1067(+)